METLFYLFDLWLLAVAHALAAVITSAVLVLCAACLMQTRQPLVPKHGSRRLGRTFRWWGG